MEQGVEKKGIWTTILEWFISILPENNRLERIWVLAKFDFKSRYYYHNLGVFWAFIKPGFEFMVYFFVFGKLMKIDIPDFALYLLLGLIVWYFFVEGTTKGIHIISQKMYLIENIRFQKIDLFLASTFSAFFGFLFNFLTYLFISLILFNPPVSVYFLLFPLLLANLFLLILGVSLLLATVNIYIRDIQHLWDMIMMAGLWATAILYSPQLLYDYFPSMQYINPMVGIVMNIRNVILYQETLNWGLFALNWIYAVIVFISGYILFQKYSHKAAEKI